MEQKYPKAAISFQLSAFSFQLSALRRHPSAKPPGLLVPPPLRCHPERPALCWGLVQGTETDDCPGGERSDVQEAL